MNLTHFTYEELNAMNAMQVSVLLKKYLPQVRHQIESVERNVGSSTATRMMNDFFPDGVPYFSGIAGQTLNEKRSLLFSLKKYQQAKTSTLAGARAAMMKTLTNSGLTQAEAKEFRQGLGGYKGLSTLYNMLEDIRRYNPDLTYTIGSDGHKMNAIIRAYEELSPKDRRDPHKVAEKAREIYERYAEEYAQQNDFPTDFRQFV